MTIVRDGIAGLPIEVPLGEFRPGIFTAQDLGIVINARTGQLVTATDPARRGDTLIILASGVGAAVPEPETGAAASGTALSYSTFPVDVVFTDAAATKVVRPDFAGLAPSFVGVHQINVTIPADAPTGSVKLYLQAAGFAPSNLVSIPVQ